jgi:hypothetical protein
MERLAFEAEKKLLFRVLLVLFCPVAFWANRMLDPTTILHLYRLMDPSEEH